MLHIISRFYNIVHSLTNFSKILFLTYYKIMGITFDKYAYYIL